MDEPSDGYAKTIVLLLLQRNMSDYRLKIMTTKAIP